MTLTPNSILCENTIKLCLALVGQYKTAHKHDLAAPLLTVFDT